MKKYILPLMAFAGVLLVSCDEDFTDWTAPQSHAQETEATAQTLSVVAGANTGASSDTAPDTLQLLTVKTANVRLDSIVLNDNYTIPFSLTDTIVTVTKAHLDSLVSTIFFSQRASQERTFSVKAFGVVRDASGQGLSAVSSAQNFVYTTSSAVPTAESAYYLVGTMNGWALNNSFPMTSNGDGTFSAIFTSSGDAYFKIFGEKGVQDVDWDAGLGHINSQYSGTRGLISWTEKLGKQPEALYIAEGGTYTLTLDVVNWTYSYEKQ